MRALLFLTIVLFASIPEAIQHTTVQISDEDFNDENFLELVNMDTYEDINNLRNLNDVKDKIKKSIALAWHTVKVISKNADAKLKAWIENIIKKVEKLENAFKERLDKLREEFKEVVKKFVAIGENVKECLEQDKDKIDKIFKTIVTNVKTCISNNVHGLSKNQITHLLLELDEATFLNNVENKLSVTCEEDDEKCLNDVRDEIITDIENAEENISQQHLEARNAVDNHLDTTVACVIEGLTTAMKTVVNETVQVIQCVKNKH